MWQHGHHGSKPAPSAAKPVPVKKSASSGYEAAPSAPTSDGGTKPTMDEHALRRARFRSRDTTTSVSTSSRGDRLEVSSCDSRRSSGISLPSRSMSQEQRLYKSNHATPASSRDSLSVNSLATEVSADCCMKSSVA
ncbi:hypothetical protein GCK32_020927, partial [Trichostrongylus colubriformis]